MQTERGKAYAEPADFEGLRWRTDPELQKSGIGPIAELEDIERGVAALDRLRPLFQRLEARGVRIPTVYSMQSVEPLVDGPKRTWREIIRDIGYCYYELGCIADMVLDKEKRDLDTMCIG